MSSPGPNSLRVLPTIMTFWAAVQQTLDAVVERNLLLHVVVAHPLQWGRGVGWRLVQKRPFSGHDDCDSNNLRLHPGQQGWYGRRISGKRIGRPLSSPHLGIRPIQCAPPGAPTESAHPLLKYLTKDLPILAPVFQVRKRWLVHRVSFLHRHRVFQPCEATSSQSYSDYPESLLPKNWMT